MNLINEQILTSTEQYWNIHRHKKIFHQTISLIISQKISFATGRQIRKQLYEKLSNINRILK